MGEIVKLGTKRNKDLIPAVKAIIRREKDNAIKKIYLTALEAHLHNREAQTRKRAAQTYN